MTATEDPSTIPREAIEGAVHIPLALLKPSPTNPRKHFDQAHLEELASSIRKHGVLTPILARPIADAKRGDPLYEVVAGERRWRASTIAEAPSIPVLLRDLSDFEVLEIQILENLHRDDLHPLEEAEGYQALLRKPDGLQGYATVDELAERIGKSRRYVFNRLALLKLSDGAREACLEGKLSVSVALLITMLPVDQQPEATKRILQGWGGEPYTQRQAAAFLRRDFSLRLEERRFPIADASLVKSAGACTACPKRTSANPDLFNDEAESADSCLDRECFDSKLQAQHERQLQHHRDLGREVIAGDAARKLIRYTGETPRGYEDFTTVSPQGLSKKPLDQLLGESFGSVVAVDTATGVRVLVKEADVRKALKAKGMLKPPPPKKAPAAERDPDAPPPILPPAKKSSSSALPAAEIKKAKENAIARLWPDLALAALGKDLAGRDTQPFTMRMARMLLEYLLQGDVEIKQVFAAIGAPLPAGHFHYVEQPFVQAALNKLSTQQVYAATVLAMASDSLITLHDKDKNPLTIIAGELGFDLQPVKDQAKADVEQRMAAELAARAPAAKPPAKAPAAGATTPGERGKAKGKAAPAASPPEATDVFVAAHASKSDETAKAAKPKPSKKKAAPRAKYVHPATGSTWSGRGLQPAWVKAWLANGRRLVDLEWPRGEEDDDAGDAPAANPKAVKLAGGGSINPQAVAA